MRSHKLLADSMLLLVAILLAVANVWFAAVRSTIPLEISGTVVRKEVRHEKHPPKDSVWLIRVGADQFQVDQAVFDAVAVGDDLQKERWSRKLLCNQQAIELDWSADDRGMLWAMPLSVGVILAAAFRGRVGRN
jgi:hypothetical protein